MERLTGRSPSAETRRRPGGARRSGSPPGVLDGDAAAAGSDAQAPRCHRDRPHRRLTLRRTPRGMVRPADSGRAARGRSPGLGRLVTWTTDARRVHGRVRPGEVLTVSVAGFAVHMDRIVRNVEASQPAALERPSEAMVVPSGGLLELQGLLRRLSLGPHDPARDRSGRRRTRRHHRLRRPGPAHRSDAQPLATGERSAHSSPTGLADRRDLSLHGPDHRGLRRHRGASFG